jgi:hypothetical protein
MTKAEKLDRHIKISQDYIKLQVKKEQTDSRKDGGGDYDMMY